jgi:hypothetical protein
VPTFCCNDTARARYHTWAYRIGTALDKTLNHILGRNAIKLAWELLLLLLLLSQDLLKHLILLT